MLLRLLVAALSLAAFQVDAKAPPETRTDNVRDIIHGVEIVDPYRWLEDQESPEARAWIDVQNAYSRPIFGAIPGRDRLERRLGELLRVESISAPMVRNGRYFFTKQPRDQDLWSIYMRRGLRGKDELIIDPHPLSPDHRITVDLRDVSKDGSVLVYSLREGGEDEVSIRLLDVDTRKELTDRLPKARYWGVSLKPDKSGLYYTRFGTEGPRLYYHAMGSNPADDREIFGEGLGRDKTLSSSLSDDGRYLLVRVAHGVGGAAKTEVYCQDLGNGGPISPVVNDIDAKFYGSIGGDRLFLQTNWQAPNWRIFAVDLNDPARENWREIIPEGKAPLQYFTLAGGRLFANYLENVVSRVKMFDPDGKFLREIPPPSLGTLGAPFGRWDSDEAFYFFSSFHVPDSVYRYDVPTGKQQVWFRPDVPVDSNKFEIKQVWYFSKDGTRVPMFILHAKGLRHDGSRPTLLTGYGGFNSSETPSFTSVGILWAERGGVFAIPNLRGGGEFGEEWHRAGMLEKKQNVFDDFIAAAEWLISNGYTKPSKLAIMGGSNGGLLVGAALTQRPDLFQAVLCRNPLLDMIRYHKFLVARWWVPEYGSSEDPEQFKYLHAYSPYHRVKRGAKYPAVLLVSGDSDTRVAPLHARKMTALLQAATGSDRPVILKYETKAGHIGAKPVSKQIEDLADEQGFLLWQVGALRGSGPPKPLPSLREQARIQQEWLKLRLERVLPQLMRKHGVQMWLVICREYNEDPVFFSLVSPDVFAARRRTIYVFFDRGPEKGVERIALGGGSNGGLYTVYRDPEVENREIYGEGQWVLLRKLIEERKPATIAINVSHTHAFADGLSAAERDKLEEVLGPEYRKRLAPAENLALEYIEMRLPEMLPVYRQMMETAHWLIARALSNEVITPGKTTDENVVWWLREQVRELGLDTWFQPMVDVLTPERPGMNILAQRKPVVIERGNVLHVDFGITAMRLNTDTQHMGYVLREGETDVPPGIKRALANTNRLQDIVMERMRPGRSGNEVLADSLAAMKAEGIIGSIYCHPVGDHGHGAGPLIGLWDRQQGVPGRGDVLLLPGTWFSIELSARTPVPEWGGKQLWVALEEDAVLDDSGRISWILERQTEYHLVR